MVFRIPKIKTCCFCMSLKAGGSIIAGLDVLAFITVLLLAEVHSPRKATFNQILIYDTVFLNIGAFSFVFAYAVIKKDRALMFPWILQQSVFCIFLLSNFLCSLAYFGLMNARLADMTMECLGLVVTSYTLLVVYNYYRELNEPKTEESN